MKVILLGNIKKELPTDILNAENICRGSGKGIAGKRGEMVKELDTLANKVINF